MLTAEAHIITDRASRYLTQLCRHADQMGHMPLAGHGAHRPPEVQHVDYSDTHGSVHFADGQWTIQATGDRLTLRVEATDEDTLRRLQNGVTKRLETIGRRDHLTVQWRPPDTAPDRPFGTTSTGTVVDAARRRRRHLARNLLLAGAAALAIVVHFGLLGGALAASTWSNWGTNIVLVLVAVKVITTVGFHAFGGRFALRHGKAFIARRRRQSR